MNVNENIRNKWKIAEKSGGSTNKIIISNLIIVLEYQTWYQSNAKI